MRERCDFCGTKLIDRDRFKSNYTFNLFLNTGKCQKCQDYDIYMGRPKNIIKKPTK